MMDQIASTSTVGPRVASQIPRSAGIGLKMEHCREIIDTHPAIGFFEVHAENYMGAGGPTHEYLRKIRDRYPVSLHGVGLSIGGPEPLNLDHLQLLKCLISKYQPGLFSEHLAWSSHGGVYFNDLLPVPYTTTSLSVICDHIDQVQSSLGMRMLLENPTSYISFSESSWTEQDFLSEIVRRTGCGLLLDINNVYISSVNLGFDPLVYLRDFPLHSVGELHLAGHYSDEDKSGRPLLIDTHDRQVSDEVWRLFDSVLERTGSLPTLIEWDTAVPDWATLNAEAFKAQATLNSLTSRCG